MSLIAAGTGRTFLYCHILRLTRETAIAAPSEFAKPTWSSKSAFLLALIYYFGVVDLPALGEHLFGSGIAPSLATGRATALLRAGLTLYIVGHAAIAEWIGAFTPPPVNLFETVFFGITRMGTAPKIEAEKKKH